MGQPVESPRAVPYDAGGWGEGVVWVEGRQLAWHELPRPPIGTRARVRVTPTQGGADNPPPLRTTIASRVDRRSKGSGPSSERLIQKLKAYFRGERQSFDEVELDVTDWTPFQLDIVSALRAVPYGEVVSYSDLARLAGYPRAQRAAGTFCARNRFGIVVPCHRVVASNGLGSYGSLGQEYKRRLLALEGVTV